MGIGTYFAQEGVFEFARQGMGAAAAAAHAVGRSTATPISLGVAKDTGVKEIKDLKGKRVGMVVGSPALNQNAFAVLAFGGLTQKRRQAGRVLQLRRDVEGHGQQRGRRRLRLHHLRPGQGGRDLAARHRLSADAGRRQGRLGAAAQDRPVTSSRTRRPAAPASPQDKPVELPSYPYPIFMAYASQPADLVYSLTKAMIASYDAYKDAAPGAAGLELDAAEPRTGCCPITRAR